MQNESKLGLRGRIILAGGSGFIGHALAQEFCRQGYEVIVLTRSPRDRGDGSREIVWDAKSVGAWSAHLEGARAVINLTGKNINCPHTPENLREIIASRVDSTNAIAAAMAQAKSPPPAWVQASAVGYYGDPGARLCDEAAPNGVNALAKICREWEAAGTAPSLPQTRKVTLRIGFVLGRDGGAFPLLARLARWFLGGAAGTGQQYISWIHLTDLVQMFVAAVENENFSGIYNAVAPEPATNAEFMRTLRRTLHRPWSPPVPEFALKLGTRVLGSEPSLVLTGQRCVPGRFLSAGFKFQFPGLAPALADLCKPV